MKSFKVNGKTYIAKEFDFNMVCDLEDMGIKLEDAAEKPMALTRAYFNICSGLGKEFAGKEIEEHMINGGTLDDISAVMMDKMNDSDFFRHLNQTEETEAPKNQRAKKTTSQ